MKAVRAAEDRSVAFSPRHFDRQQGKGRNTTSQKTAAEKRQQAERRRFPPRAGARVEVEAQNFTGKKVVAREPKTPVRPLNLSANPGTGRSTGSLAPRENSSRVTPRSRPITTRPPSGASPMKPNARLQGLRAGILSERLGHPTRPSSGLPTGKFPRPVAVPKRSEADQAKAEKERALRCMRCFELQWGFVCAELEAAISRHQQQAKIQLLDSALARCDIQKALKDLKDCKAILEAQAQSEKAGEAAGDLLHKLHKNRAAFIQRVKELKAFVKGVLEDIPGDCPPEDLRENPLRILNAMKPTSSQKAAGIKSTETGDSLSTLGKLSLSRETLERLDGLSGVGGNSKSKRRVQRAVKAGTCEKETRELLRERLRPIVELHVLVRDNIQRQEELGSLRAQAAKMIDLVQVRGERAALMQS